MGQCSWCGRYIGDKSQIWHINVEEDGQLYQSQEVFCSKKCTHEYPYSGTPNKNPNLGCYIILIIIALFLLFIFTYNPSVEDTNSINNSTNDQIRNESVIVDNNQPVVENIVIDSNQQQNDAQTSSNSNDAEIENNLRSQNLTRDPRDKGYANILFNPRYTLYDFLTDTPILPNENGIYELYYTSNENPTPRKFIGTGNQLASIKEFKFVNYENCEKMCENIKTSQTPKID